MSTTYRIQNQNALYFLTLTIVEWIDLFTRERNRRIIIESLEYCRKNKGLRIWAYVIMTNHVHLLVSAEDGNLSGILRDFKRYTARRLLESVMDSEESRLINCVFAPLREKTSIRILYKVHVDFSLVFGFNLTPVSTGKSLFQLMIGFS